MAYKDYFATKFRQSDMIGTVLKAANKKADLKTEKDGVCSPMTMHWIINSLRMAAACSINSEFNLDKQCIRIGIKRAFECISLRDDS